MANPVVAVAAGVLVRAGKVLVGQRAAGSSHAGKWEFPGGKLEPGESLVECMRRELHEELAIEVRVERVLWQTRHVNPDSGKVHELTFFLIDPQHAGELRNQVFTEIRWLALEELTDLDLLDSDRAFVAALRRGEVHLS